MLHLRSMVELVYVRLVVPSCTEIGEQIRQREKEHRE